MSAVQTQRKTLKNQVVTSEGIQNYFEGGKVVKKLKTWDNLQKFIGVKVPITDGHPPTGIVEKDTIIHGYAVYKACPNGKNTLCADFDLNEDAPNRKGYSAGYLYEPVKAKKGAVYNGQKYDLIQKWKVPDHIALTDHARHPYAIKVSGDHFSSDQLSVLLSSLSVPTLEKDSVVKYEVCIDEYRSFIGDDNMGKNNPTPRPAEIRSEAKGSKNAPGDKENKKGQYPDKTKAPSNNNEKTEKDPGFEKKKKDGEEINTSKKKEKKTEGDNMTKEQLSELDSLRAYKAEKDAEEKANDAYKNKLAEMQKATDAKDKLIADKDAKIANFMKAKVDGDVKSIKAFAKKIGCDEKKIKEFLKDGDETFMSTVAKTLKFVGDNTVSVSTSMGEPAGDSTHKAAGNDTRQGTTANMHYDADSGQMVYNKGFGGK